MGKSKARRERNEICAEYSSLVHTLLRSVGWTIGRTTKQATTDRPLSHGLLARYEIVKQYTAVAERQSPVDLVDRIKENYRNVPEMSVSKSPSKKLDLSDGSVPSKFRPISLQRWRQITIIKTVSWIPTTIKSRVSDAFVSRIRWYRNRIGEVGPWFFGFIAVTLYGNVEVDTMVESWHRSNSWSISWCMSDYVRSRIMYVLTARSR